MAIGSFDKLTDHGTLPDGFFSAREGQNKNQKNPVNKAVLKQPLEIRSAAGWGNPFSLQVFVGQSPEL